MRLRAPHYCRESDGLYVRPWDHEYQWCLCRFTWRSALDGWRIWIRCEARWGIPARIRTLRWELRDRWIRRHRIARIGRCGVLSGKSVYHGCNRIRPLDRDGLCRRCEIPF